MKYTTLRSDILGILHSADYGFTLKLYDKSGSSTLDPEEADWIYLFFKEDNVKNILITLPTELDSNIYIWKDSNSKESEDEDKKYDKTLESIIQRIRELSILNGISVKVETFNNLDRRKIYNLIKDAMAKRKKEMKESVDQKLSNALFELNNVVRNTKKSSDYYVSEQIAYKNKMELVESIINGIKGFKGLNTTKMNKFLSLALIETSMKDLTKSLVEFMQKNPKEYEILKENAQSIKNIGQFAKARYLNNGSIERKPQTIMFLENVMVYPARTNIDKENLVKAYNHLISVSESAKTGTDILLAIKKHNLCETYKVSKDDLLDMWLSKTVDETIEPKTLIVFETVEGEKISFSMDMKPSIKLLAEHFNNHGLENDNITEEIVSETIKLNRLTDLVENYFYNTSIKKYGSTIKKLVTESLTRLKNKDFENKQTSVDYSKELALVEGKVGFKHPALKYIAISEAQEREANDMHLTLERVKDERILRECLEKSLICYKAKEVAESIIKNNIIVTKDIKESLSKEDCMGKVKSLYKNIYTTDANTKEALDECLFLMMKNPNMNSSKKRFINTLEKYILK